MSPLTRCLLLIACWGALLLSLPVHADGPLLNAPGDAGAAGAPASGAPPAAVDDAAVRARYPLYQAARNEVLGGGVRGFGLLAEYPAPGPRRVWLRRTTLIPPAEPYAPITLARVFDPDGHLVAIREFTAQATAVASCELTLPRGNAGAWRVSFSGGRRNDRFEIGLPATDTWGVRGEMALGITETTPRTAYLYLPRTVTTVILEGFGRQNPGMELVSENGQSLGKPQWVAAKRRNLLIVDPAPANTVCTLALEGREGDALVFDGVPGLLCPTAAAARRLAGGCREAEGLLVAGPLQARVRQRMVAIAKQPLAPQLRFPTSVPATLKYPRREALLYGKYGPLGSLASTLPRQMVDPASPYLGAFMADAKPGDPARPSWETFLHAGVLNPFDAGGLAAAITVPTRLNPARDNQALIRRATLAAFYHVVSLQGDDLIREGEFRNGNYPLTHAFFVYDGALAKPYLLLREKLDGPTRALWREALLAVGDKMADYQAYESNQWAHVIVGHLHTYRATGEPRFLGYFERLMTAYLDNTFGPASKFGQHPAGFYLEEYGPDGNYDHLNAFCVNAAYYEYRALRAAQPALVAKLKAAIEKNLRFKSFFWMPQPDGSFYCPTALNCRTAAFLSNPSYPGDYLAAPEFPLAATRYALIKDPGTGAGDAGTFSHLANNDAWARRVLETFVPRGDKAFDMTNAGGGWTTELYDAYRLPQIAQPAAIPIQHPAGTWTLPGLIAWKRGPLYGLVFHDVIGAQGTLSGRMGGGPMALWSPGTGVVVSSMRNPQWPKVTTAQDLTHACVYGEDAGGALFWSGNERSQCAWIEDGHMVEIRAALARPAGELVWRYTFGEAETTLAVSLTTRAPVRAAWVSLPINLREKDAVLTDPADGAFTFALGAHAMRFAWAPDIPARLEAPAKTSHADVRCLRWPLPADGTPLTIRISATP